jgi:hypothetical protein
MKSKRGLTVNDTTETRIEYGWKSQDKFQVEDPSIWIADNVQQFIQLHT